MVQNSTDGLQEIPAHLGGISFQDGTGQLAVISSNLTGRDWDGCLAVFDDPTFAPNIPHVDFGVKVESGCTSVGWVNETRIVASTDSGSVEVWDMKERPLLENSLHLCEHGDVCSSISISTHTSQLASGGWDNLIKLWDLEVDMSINTFRLHSGRIFEVKWNRYETDVFASVSEDQTCIVYDHRKDDKPGLIAAKTEINHPSCIEWIDNNKVAIGMGNGGIVLYDVRYPNIQVAECKSHQNYVTKMIAFDGCLYSTGEDCRVYGHDLNKLETKYKDARHTDYVKDICVNPKDNTVWSCAWDGKIYCHTPKSKIVEMES